MVLVRRINFQILGVKGLKRDLSFCRPTLQLSKQAFRHFTPISRLTQRKTKRNSKKYLLSYKISGHSWKIGKQLHTATRNLLHLCANLQVVTFFLKSMNTFLLKSSFFLVHGATLHAPHLIFQGYLHAQGQWHL